MRKKNKGFTLIETILVIGIIALIGAGIYSSYVKKYNNFTVQRQSQYVIQIIQQLEKNFMSLSDASANASASSTAITSAVNPPTRLISSNIIPEEMKASATTVKNLWGGSVTFTGITVSNTALVELTFNGVPQEACAKFITNPSFTNISQVLQVNGTQVKALGASVVDSNTASNACNQVTNNIVKISTDISKRGVEPITLTGAAGHFRDKETKYYIAPPIGAITSTGPTCSGGATFNATSSTCECPAGQSWDGKLCKAFVGNSTNTLTAIQGRAGNCPLGQGWNMYQLRCDVLPAGSSSASVSRTLAGTSITVTTPAGVSTSGTFVAGREVPNNIWSAANAATPVWAPNLSTLAQRTTTNVNNCTSGLPPTSSRPSNNGIGNFDGQVCQVCIVGTWNGDRCVTP